MLIFWREKLQNDPGGAHSVNARSAQRRRHGQECVGRCARQSSALLPCLRPRFVAGIQVYRPTFLGHTLKSAS